MKIECFVCRKPLIEEWIDAMIDSDFEQQKFLQGEMEYTTSFEDLTQFEISILYQCSTGNSIDYTQSIAELYAEVDASAGPWVMAVAENAVKALAALTIGDGLISKWIEKTNHFTQEGEAKHANVLTAAAAERLRQLCSIAVDKEADVFICFYE
jgi:hypothetical protein